MRYLYLPLVLLLPLAALPACHKDKAGTESASNGAAAHVPGTPRTDDVLNAWRNAGLAPQGFAQVTPPPNSATYCERGQVRGVDTLVCEYANEETIVRGMQQVKEGWARVDAHTGVVLRAKLTTMVVVDRERREPSGKTISQMTKLFGAL